VTQSNFVNNTALYESGGALGLSCIIKNENKCIFNLNNNSFSGNKAPLKGGAIYYDLYSPIGLESCKFSNNSAAYGSDIGSYPFKLKLKADSINPKLDSLVSGGQNLEPIHVGIYDQ
jgi:predicted outer membrane repeat protein